MKTIQFNKRVQFLGRNGYFNAEGIEISNDVWINAKTLKEDRIHIAPITTKGLTGRCFVEVPTENIPEFIGALLKESGLNDSYLFHRKPKPIE